MHEERVHERGKETERPGAVCIIIPVGAPGACVLYINLFYLCQLQVSHCKNRSTCVKHTDTHTESALIGVRIGVLNTSLLFLQC